MKYSLIVIYLWNNINQNQSINQNQRASVKLNYGIKLQSLAQSPSKNGLNNEMTVHQQNQGARLSSRGRGVRVDSPDAIKFHRWDTRGQSQSQALPALFYALMKNEVIQANPAGFIHSMLHQDIGLAYRQARKWRGGNDRWLGAIAAIGASQARLHYHISYCSGKWERCWTVRSCRCKSSPCRQ